MTRPNEISLLSNLQAKLYEIATKDLEKNHDADRFGAKPRRKLDSLRDLVKNAARTRGIVFQKHQSISETIVRLKNSQENPLELLETYRLLEDEYSRGILLELFLQRSMGAEKVKLSRNSEKYWQERDVARSLQSNRLPAKKLKFMNWLLPHFDLKGIGYDLNLFCSAIGVDLTFVKKQYEYSGIKPAIAVKSGDIVIDAGACYGDTALYFAAKAGSTGKVISFEFDPENLEVFRKNLELNPNYSPQVDVIERPIWETSEKVLYMVSNGPGSKISEKPLGDEAVEVKTISIDDMVRERNLSRVDFIKMDIEGAELPALKGARDTIARFKPTLAICVYHKPDDWIEIPKFIKSLNPDYKMWLDHFTIYPEETVLFCKL